MLKNGRVASASPLRTSSGRGHADVLDGESSPTATGRSRGGIREPPRPWPAISRPSGPGPISCSALPHG
jgi:hypothetical protein